MNLRLFLERAVAFMPSRRKRYLSHPNTSRFLKERNARLIIQMKDSHSFYGQRLDNEMRFTVGQDSFRIRTDLQTYRALSISIFNGHGVPILQEKVPIRALALAHALNLDKALVIIEIDADPAINIV